MGYSIHIKRGTPDGETIPILLEEWRDVIARTEDVRMAVGPFEITNPKTGEVISFQNNGGDVEVFYPDSMSWERALRWFRGRVSFNAPDDFDEPSCRIRQIASRLAQALSAHVVGDEGETYD